jgi:transcriptional regulator with XRE-family HTH domain
MIKLNYDKLAYLRGQRGLSQQKLAELAGVTRHTIIYLEQGKHVPTTITLANICKALDIEDPWKQGIIYNQ